MDENSSLQLLLGLGQMSRWENNTKKIIWQTGEENGAAGTRGLSLNAADPRYQNPVL